MCINVVRRNCSSLVKIYFNSILHQNPFYKENSRSYNLQITTYKLQCAGNSPKCIHVHVDEIVLFPGITVAFNARLTTL